MMSRSFQTLVSVSTCATRQRFTATVDVAHTVVMASRKIVTAGAANVKATADASMGLHSSTFQLTLSHF